MRANSLSLVILIVLVELNRYTASMSTSTMKTTTTIKKHVDDLDHKLIEIESLLKNLSKSYEKAINKNEESDEEFVRNMQGYREPKKITSTERNLKNPHISTKLEKGRKNETEDYGSDEDALMARELMKEIKSSTERNLKNSNILTELEKGRKNETQDNPLFVVVPGLISVPDDLPVSSVLGKVTATDPTNQGRKCFYHLTNSTPDLFNVDTDTGVITTKKRLDTMDTVEDHSPVTTRNVTDCVITISTTFHNFIDQSLYDGKFHLEDIQVMVKVLHGPLRNLTRDDKQNGTKLTVASSSWDGGNNWMQISILAGNAIIMVIVLVILVIVVAMGIDKWRNPPSPPKCAQAVPEPSKI